MKGVAVCFVFVFNNQVLDRNVNLHPSFIHVCKLLHSSSLVRLVLAPFVVMQYISVVHTKNAIHDFSDIIQAVTRKTITCVTCYRRRCFLVLMLVLNGQ